MIEKLLWGLFLLAEALRAVAYFILSPLGLALLILWLVYSR